MKHSFQLFNWRKKKYIWELSASQFIFLIIIVNLLVYHLPLYRYISGNLDNVVSLNGASVIFTISAVIFVYSIIIFGILATFLPALLKPFSILAAFFNSIAVYFLSTYQIILDVSMMGNIFNTRTEEAIEFLHPSLLIYMFFLGIIPAWLLLKIKVKKVKRLSLLRHTFIAIITGILFIYVNSASWLWIDEHAKYAGGKVLPWSYIINPVRYYNEQSDEASGQELLPAASFFNSNKIAVVLIIGEAARAQNFSLYGYQRKTNPKLEKAGITTFKNTKACSTYTTASLTCLLAHDGDNGGAYEPLPSYLTRHDVDVIWRTKNWGEPLVNVSEYQSSAALEKICTGNTCEYDELLLTGLGERILSSNKQKIFIVLHTKGSHGPSYYTRYSKDFEEFKPVCKSVEPNQCSYQELINAYDNTILYTDYFINQTINVLKKVNNIPTVLFYISDHGESLGEYGLYLHGTPYPLAPDFQKNIPFVIWMSKQFVDFKGYKGKRFMQKQSYSHDNIFHSIIGAFDMNSEIYDESLDVFNDLH